MKTVSEYLLPRPGDPVEQFPVYLPQSCEVKVYEPDAEHDDWRVVCKVYALDVKTDEYTFFETRWNTPQRPTRAECAQVVVNMLVHEVQEQLGFDPHAVVVPSIGEKK